MQLPRPFGLNGRVLAREASAFTGADFRNVCNSVTQAFIRIHFLLLFFFSLFFPFSPSPPLSPLSLSLPLSFSPQPLQRPLWGDVFVARQVMRSQGHSQASSFLSFFFFLSPSPLLLTRVPGMHAGLAPTKTPALHLWSKLECQLVYLHAWPPVAGSRLGPIPPVAVDEAKISWWTFVR